MLVSDTWLSDNEDIIGDPTPEHIEYYLDILVDKEIPEEDICIGIKNLKTKDIFLDEEIKCPDRDDMEVNIYGTRVTPQDIEDCE